MRVDTYRVLSEAVALGIGKTWRKTLDKISFSEFPDQFQRRFLAKLVPVVMVEILEFISLDETPVNARKLMARCVLSGSRAGWRRAFKHTSTPSPERIQEAIHSGILLEVHEYFSFTDESDGASSLN